MFCGVNSSFKSYFFGAKQYSYFRKNQQKRVHYFAFKSRYSNLHKVQVRNSPDQDFFDNTDLDFLRDKLGWDNDDDDDDEGPGKIEQLTIDSPKSTEIFDDRQVDTKYNVMTTKKLKTAVFESDSLQQSRPIKELKKEKYEKKGQQILVEEMAVPQSYIEEAKFRRPAPRPKQYEEAEFFPTWYRPQYLIKFDKDGNIIDENASKKQKVKNTDNTKQNQTEKQNTQAQKSSNQNGHTQVDNQIQTDPLKARASEILQDFLNPEDLLKKLTTSEVDPVEFYKIRRAHRLEQNQSPEDIDNWEPPFQFMDDFDALQNTLQDIQLPLKGQNTCKFNVEWRREFPMPGTDFVSHLFRETKVMLEVTLTSNKKTIRDWLLENLWYPSGGALNLQKRRKLGGRRPKQLLKSEIPQISVRVFWKDCHKPETWDLNDQNEASVIVFSNMRKILIVQLSQMKTVSKSIQTAMTSEHVIKIVHNFGPQLERFQRKRSETDDPSERNYRRYSKNVSKCREAYSFVQYAYRLDNGVKDAPEIFDQVEFCEASSKVLGIKWSDIDENVTSEFGNKQLSLEAIAYLCRKTYPLLPFYMAFFKITRRKAFEIVTFLEKYAHISKPNACINEANDRMQNIMRNYRRDKNDYSDGWDEEDVVKQQQLDQKRQEKYNEKIKLYKKKKATVSREYINKIKLDIYKKRMVPGSKKNRYLMSSQSVRESQKPRSRPWE